MTTHTKLLEIIRRMSKMPKHDTYDLLYYPEYDSYYDDGSCGERVSKQDAHAHIEIAALGVVREWCKKNRSKHLMDSCLMIDDYDDEVALMQYRGHPQVLLGRGPTLAAALLAALTYIEEYR